MADRHFKQMRALDEEVIHLFGIVTFGGSGAVASQTSLGFTVTKPAGTGLYRITLEDKYPELLGVFLTKETDDATSNAQWQAKTSSMSAGTIDINHALSSTGAEADAVSGDRVHIHVVLKNSTRLP